METATLTRIGLEVGCAPECDELSEQLYLQMAHGYEECAVLPLTSLERWRDEHRTGRKRADRSAGRGYKFERIKRHRCADDIHRINLSAPSRQGRPMSAGYRARPSETPLPEYPCERHNVVTYGIKLDGGVIAYATIYRMGELALVSQILGHAEHLEHEVMYLLVQGVVELESEQGGYLVYNRWDSGTDGLRFFKARCGFDRTDVEWAP